MYIITPNPSGRSVGDCAIRAIAKALDIDWEDAYAKLVVNGFRMADMPSSNNVIASVLRMHGFRREAIPDSCPECYTIKDFVEDHPKGTYIVGTGNHVVAVVDGRYYDSWNSGDEVPLYYWRKD